MRVLLDEHFPDPPGFDPSHLDANLRVVSLCQHDESLVGKRTPDWYLYLVAHASGFDALVTRDWRQSAQTEEMWIAAQTRVSIITWRKGQDDLYLKALTNGGAPVLSVRDSKLGRLAGKAMPNRR